MKIILVTVLITSFVVGFIQWYRRKGKVDVEISKYGLKRISKRDFKKIIGKRKFSCMHSWVATPATYEYLAGMIKGYSICLFSIAVGRSTCFLTVLIRADFSKFPNFVIKPKSFTEEVGDMLGLRDHHPSYPVHLIDKYDVSSDDDTLLASLLMPEIIGYFMKYESIWVEVLGGDLMIHHPLLNNPENFKDAIEKSCELASLFGVTPDASNGVDTPVWCQGGEKTFSSNV